MKKKSKTYARGFHPINKTRKSPEPKSAKTIKKANSPQNSNSQHQHRKQQKTFFKESEVIKSQKNNSYRLTIPESSNRKTPKYKPKQKISLDFQKPKVLKNSPNLSLDKKFDFSTSQSPEKKIFLINEKNQHLKSRGKMINLNKKILRGTGSKLKKSLNQKTLGKYYNLIEKQEKKRKLIKQKLLVENKEMSTEKKLEKKEESKTQTMFQIKEENDSYESNKNPKKYSNLEKMRISFTKSEKKGRLKNSEIQAIDTKSSKIKTQKTHNKDSNFQNFSIQSFNFNFKKQNEQDQKLESNPHKDEINKKKFFLEVPAKRNFSKKSEEQYEFRLGASDQPVNGLLSNPQSDEDSEIDPNIENLGETRDQDSEQDADPDFLEISNEDSFGYRKNQKKLESIKLINNNNNINKIYFLENNKTKKTEAFKKSENEVNSKENEQICLEKIESKYESHLDYYRNKNVSKNSKIQSEKTVPNKKNLFNTDQRNQIFSVRSLANQNRQIKIHQNSERINFNPENSKSQNNFEHFQKFEKNRYSVQSLQNVNKKFDHTQNFISQQHYQNKKSENEISFEEHYPSIQDLNNLSAPKNIFEIDQSNQIQEFENSRQFQNPDTDQNENLRLTENDRISSDLYYSSNHEDSENNSNKVPENIFQEDFLFDNYAGKFKKEEKNNTDLGFDNDKKSFYLREVRSEPSQNIFYNCSSNFVSQKKTLIKKNKISDSELIREHEDAFLEYMSRK